MEYIRISKGLNDYKLHPNTVNINSIIESAGDKDYYYGIYTYDDRHYELWKVKKSLAGIRDVKTNKLVWDFDSENDIEIARSDAREAYTRLLKSGFNTNDIQIYFSGNKGFHLVVNLSEKLKRKEFENVVFGLCGDLATLDPTVKDQQRLLRLPFTKNQKSGLYCIPLNLADFNNSPISVIKEQATSLSDENWILYQNWVNKYVALPQVLVYLKDKNLKDQKEESEEVTFEDRLDIERKPKWLSPTKFALQEGFFKVGERNTAFMILAATYRAQGLPKEIAWRMLKGVAELQARRNNSDEYPADQLWKEVIGCVYGPDWKGGTYSEKETEILRLTAERFNLVLDDLHNQQRLVSYTDMRKKVSDLASQFNTQRLFTGLEEIDNDIVIIKGMCFGVLGSPNAGKTTFINNIVQSLADEGKLVLFESLDMGDVLMGVKPVLRKLNGAYDLSGLMSAIEGGKDLDRINKAFDDTENEQKNITYNYRSSSVEDIEEDIKSFSRIKGKYPDLVVVDYFEKIRGPKGDPQGDAQYIIPRLTDLAKEYNICIAILLQPQKAAGDMNEPLLSMRKIKGSSIIEQDLRLIFTLWRPGANRGNNSQDNFMQVAVVKNNMGTLERYEFHWTGRTGDIRTLTGSERRDLTSLLEDIAEEKKQEESNGYKKRTL